MVRFDTNRVGKKHADQELAQSNWSLSINAEIWECGTASSSGEDRYIIIIKIAVGAGHCRGGVVRSKKRTAVGTV